jgi:hypothetical protein
VSLPWESQDKTEARHGTEGAQEGSGSGRKMGQGGREGSGACVRSGCHRQEGKGERCGCQFRVHGLCPVAPHGGPSDNARWIENSSLSREHGGQRDKGVMPRQAGSASIEIPRADAALIPKGSSGMDYSCR